MSIELHQESDIQNMGSDKKYCIDMDSVLDQSEQEIADRLGLSASEFRQMLGRERMRKHRQSTAWYALLKYLEETAKSFLSFIGYAIVTIFFFAGTLLLPGLIAYAVSSILIAMGVSETVVYTILRVIACLYPVVCMHYITNMADDLTGEKRGFVKATGFALWITVIITAWSL